MLRKIIVILVIILIVGGVFLLTKNNYDLSKKQPSNELIKAYSGWVVKIVKNSATIVGDTIKMDWIPK